MSRISDPDAGSYVCEPCDFLVTPTLTVNNKKCAKFTGARTRLSRAVRGRLRHTGPK